MQVGDINLVSAIVDLEQRVGTLEKVLDHIMNNNRSLNLPSQSDVDRFRKSTGEELQKKYPNMGIQFK